MAQTMAETATYGKIKAILDRLEAGASKEDPPDTRALEVRARYIANRLLTVNPELLPPHMTAVIDSNLDQAAGQINDYLSNRNRPHLRAATEALGKATVNLLSMPTLGSAEDLKEGFADILMSTANSADSMLAAVKKDLDGVAEKVRELESKQSELDTQLQSAKERSDKAIAEYQQQFSDSENQRNIRFEKRIDTLAAEVQGASDRFDAQFDTIRGNFEKEAKAVLDRLNKRDEETQRLAHAMGAKGTSATFQATANKNQWAADWLRGLAIFLLLAAAVTVGITVYHLTKVDPVISGLRLLGAFIVILPATYLARESSKQRAEAVRSRRIEIELASLGPFIETLDEQTKADLKKRLVDTYFGRAFDKIENDEEDSIRLGGTAVDILKVIKGFIK